MDQLGKVLEWHDDKGYGFIAALDDSSATHRVFFHISTYRQSGQRPEIGELVRFRPGRGSDGRPCAQSVQCATARRKAPKAKANPSSFEIPTPVALLLICAFSAFVGWAVLAERLPATACFAIALLSAFAYLAYAFDKHAAQRGRWRMSETTLHALELLGGWPGALIAQRVMRHKTRKASYRMGFWMAVTVNCAALGWWIARP